MTTEMPKKSPVKFLLTIIGLAAIAMVATVIIGYFVTSQPRGFMVWVLIGFLCTLEFLIGILTVNSMTKTRAQYRPSGATIAITYGVAGLFAISGLLSIVIYWSIRNTNGSGDGSFIAALLGIFIFWFIIAALIYFFDLHSQVVAQPLKEKRAEHREYARSLNPILLAVRSVKTSDDKRLKRLSIITKNLESINIALAHSHGGGIGSLETGRSHSLDPEQDKVIQDGIGMMGSILSRLSDGTSGDFDAALSELEQIITRVSAAVNSLEL